MCIFFIHEAKEGIEIEGYPLLRDLSSYVITVIEQI